jgi:hypothetical protein
MQNLKSGKRGKKNRADWEKSIKDWTAVPSKKKTIIHSYFLMNYPKGPR